MSCQAEFHITSVSTLYGVYPPAKAPMKSGRRAGPIIFGMIYEIFPAIAINVYFSFELSRQSAEGGGIRFAHLLNNLFNPATR